MKFFGDREGIYLKFPKDLIFFKVRGILKGYDPLLNLVIDDSVEYLRDSESENEATRKLGRVVCRGPTVTSISPMEGFEVLDHSPFDLE